MIASSALPPPTSHAAAGGPPKRRLFATFCAIGDLVMFTPLLRHLARDGGLELVARPWAVGLLAGQPWLAAVHGLAEPHKGSSALGDWWWGGPRRELAARLAGRFDQVVGFASESPAAKRFLRACAAGAPVLELPLRLRDPGHTVDKQAPALAAAGLGIDGFDPVPRLEVPAPALAAARARLAPLGARVLAVQAGSSLTDRAWWRRARPNLKGLSAAQWAALLARILAAGDADAAVLHGTAAEGGLARAILAALPEAARPRVHDWTGRAPLREMPALLAAHRALLSVDTGPAHIAAAVGCPLLSVFGPTDPAHYLPRGPGPVGLVLGQAPCQFCHGTPAWDRCRANLCLTGLDGERLWSAWRELQDRRP